MRKAKVRVALMIFLVLYVAWFTPSVYAVSSEHLLIDARVPWLNSYPYSLLEVQALDTAMMYAPYQLPARDSLNKYSMLILLDIFNSFSAEQETCIKDFVSQGGSLLIMGGPHTLGSGNYNGTIIGDILPVKLQNTDYIAVNEKVKWSDIIDPDLQAYFGGTPLNDLYITGHNVVQPKSGSHVLMWGNSSHDPILVVGEYGLGKVIVLTAYGFLYYGLYYHSGTWETEKQIFISCIRWSTDYDNALLRVYLAILSAVVISLLVVPIVIRPNLLTRIQNSGLGKTLAKRVRAISKGGKHRAKRNTAEDQEPSVPTDRQRGRKSFVFEGIILSLPAILVTSGWWFGDGIPIQFESMMYIGTFAFSALYFVKYSSIPIWNSYWWYGQPVDVSITYFIAYLIFITPVAAMIGAVAAYKVFSTLLLIAAGLNMYFMTYRFTHNRVASIASGLLYQFNAFVLGEFIIWGHFEIFLAYSFFPLVFLVYDEALDKRTVSSALKAGFVAAAVILLSAEVRMMVYFFIIAILPYSIFSLLRIRTPTNPESKSRKSHSLGIDLGRLKVMTIYGIVILLGTMTYWYPFVIAQFRYFGMAPAGQTYISLDWLLQNSPNFLTALGLRGFGWGVPLNQMSVGVLGAGTLIVFLPFGLAMCAVALKRNKYTEFFTFGLIFSIFFACGLFAPLFQPYVYALAIPQLSFMKVPYRILGMASFFAAFLFGVTCAFISGHRGNRGSLTTAPGIMTNSRRLRKYKAKKVLQYALVALIVFSVAYSVVGEPQDTFALTNRSYPQLEQAYDWVSQNDQSSHIMKIPPFTSIELYGEPVDTSIYGPGTLVVWYPTLVHAYMALDKGLLSTWGDEVPLQGGWRIAEYQIRYIEPTLSNNDPGSLNDYLKPLLGLKYLVVYKKELSMSILSNIMSWPSFNATGPNNDEVAVLETSNPSGRLFVSSSPILVASGSYARSIPFISSLNVDSSRTPTIFLVDPLQTTNIDIRELAKLSRTLFISQSTWNDTIITYALESIGSKVTIVPEEHVASGQGWSFSDYQQPAYNIFSATASGPASMNIPVVLLGSDPANYSLFMRAYTDNYRGNLTVSVDGNLLRDINYLREEPIEGFHWKYIGTIRPGKHTLRIDNLGNGWNDVDSIAIVDPREFGSRLNQIESTLTNSITKGNMSFLIHFTAESMLLSSVNGSITRSWENMPASHPTNGEDVSIAAQGGRVSARLYIPTDGRYYVNVKVLQHPLLRANDTIQIDSVNVTKFNPTGAVQWIWKEMPVNFTSGYHEIGILSDSGGWTDLDEITVSRNQNLTEILEPLSKETNAAVTYEETGPGQYSVHVSTNEHILITLTESSFPGWIATSDNNTIYNPIIVNSLFTGFFIDRVGKYNLIIRYASTPQVGMSETVSLLTFGSIAAYLLYVWFDGRQKLVKLRLFIRKKLRNRRRKSRTGVRPRKPPHQLNKSLGKP